MREPAELQRPALTPSVTCRPDNRRQVTTLYRADHPTHRKRVEVQLPHSPGRHYRSSRSSRF
ncbi:hypothetical protein M2272_005604 [Mycobacterium frederiksbergense]|uniref:Uncharacterized protein n=1 Tax=Mycolicibacterium frederiksbergense TaxID=117567 RepID=A0ABT6L9A0_9MYCO|nr:hypothetical protein [Mycolicibacterium frederiksbergense]MDH6198940.1 hypothetical protein [Mycolicibacterium frederiksbergense]